MVRETPLLMLDWSKTELSKKRAAAMVMRASPRPFRRSEARARMVATTAAMQRSDDTAEQNVEPEVVGQLGGA